MAGKEALLESERRVGRKREIAVQRSIRKNKKKERPDVDIACGSF